MGAGLAAAERTSAAVAAAAASQPCVQVRLVPTNGEHLQCFYHAVGLSLGYQAQQRSGAADSAYTWPAFHQALREGIEAVQDNKVLDTFGFSPEDQQQAFGAVWGHTPDDKRKGYLGSQFFQRHQWGGHREMHLLSLSLGINFRTYALKRDEQGHSIHTALVSAAGAGAGERRAGRWRILHCPMSSSSVRCMRTWLRCTEWRPRRWLGSYACRPRPCRCRRRKASTCAALTAAASDLQAPCIRAHPPAWCLSLRAARRASASRLRQLVAQVQSWQMQTRRAYRSPLLLQLQLPLPASAALPARHPPARRAAVCLAWLQASRSCTTVRRRAASCSTARTSAGSTTSPAPAQSLRPQTAGERGQRICMHVRECTDFHPPLTLCALLCCAVVLPACAATAHLSGSSAEAIRSLKTR
jgi:hypothetical protein